MERLPQIWFTRLDEPKEEADTSRPECSICYDAYDHVFKKPKVLECSHTFCLECLSHLANGGAGDGLPCPLCRRRTELPSGGPLALTTSQEILLQLPGPQRREEPVWLEGGELCCKSVDSAGAPEAMCICVGIGAARTPRAGGAPRWSRPSTLYLQLNKRMMVSMALTALVLLIVISIIFRSQDCVELQPTMRPANPRGPPPTSPAYHKVDLTE